MGAMLFLGLAGDHWWPAASDWPWLLQLAIVCKVFAYSASMWVLKRLTPFIVGMATDLETLYGMLLAPLMAASSWAMLV